MAELYRQLITNTSTLPGKVSLATLGVLITTGVLLRMYFRGRTMRVAEAAAVGALWLAVNLVLDYPMFA